MTPEEFSSLDQTQVDFLFDQNVIPLPPTLDEADALGLSDREYEDLCIQHLDACNDDHCLFCPSEEYGDFSHFYGW